MNQKNNFKIKNTQNNFIKISIQKKLNKQIKIIIDELY
jgi:hypothetical protein